MLAADAGSGCHDRWYSPDLRVTFLRWARATPRWCALPAAGDADRRRRRVARRLRFRERVVARYLWAEKIMRVDYLVVSHPDLDHFGDVLHRARFRAPRIWVTGAIKHEAMYTALLAQVAAEKIPLRIVRLLDAPADTGSARCDVLGPAPDETANRDNDLSMVLRSRRACNKARRRPCFAGDLEAAGEATLLAHAPPAMLAATVSTPSVGAAHRLPRRSIAVVRPRWRFFRSATAIISISRRPNRRALCRSRSARLPDQPQRRGRCGPRQTSARW